MPNLATTNLTAGELSPTMIGRADVQRYANGCQVLENWLLTASGMWSFRPGMEIMGFTKHPTGRCILRRFQFSDEQGYILEIGALYFRIYHSLGAIVVGGEAVEVATLLDEADIDTLSFTQSADYLFVIGESKGVYIIARTSHTAWSVIYWQLFDGPYLPINTDAARTLTFTTAGPATAIDVEAAGFAPFLPGDLGRNVGFMEGTGWRYIILTAVADSTHATGTLYGGPLGTAEGVPTMDFRLGLYSSAIGWPACGKIVDQRLVLGGPASVPDRLDGSQLGNYGVFTPGVDKADAWAFALGMEDVNRIIELAIANDLIAFTVGREHRVAGDSTGQPVTPTDIWAKPIAPDGSRRIEPVAVGDNAIAFIDKAGLNVRAIQFDLRSQSYGTDNLTLIADHMAWLDPASPGFQGLAFQGNPIGTLWTIRGNGELAGCLYNPREQQLGWHRHPMGSAAGETAHVEDIEVMKGTTHDELWAVVRRELPGRTLRTIERMGRPGLWSAPAGSELRLDCGLSLRNTPDAALEPAAATGSHVRFDLAGGTFAFTAAHVGQFLKYRYSTKGRRGQLIYKVAIAKIVEWAGSTACYGAIVAPFPSTAALPAGSWGLTVSRVTGLGHLEGLGVMLVSDGRVFGPRTVTLGAVDLDVPGWEVHAGLGYDGYLVTMPLDPGPSAVVGQGRQARLERCLVRVVNSVGGEIAALPETEDEPVSWQPMLPYTQGEAAPQAVPQLRSKDFPLWPAGPWTRRAELAVRQTQPLPCNVALVIEHAYAPWIQP